MRTLAVLLAALTTWIASPDARACSWNPCYFGSQRIASITLLTDGPVPTDGALVFATDQEISPICLAELIPKLSLAVTRDGLPVPGALVQLDGLLDFLIWRPGESLDPGTTYEIAITFDNSSFMVSQPNELDTSDEICGPELLLAAFSLTTGDGPAAPQPPPAPSLTATSLILDDTLLGLACCPDISPEYEGGACYPDVSWDSEDPNGCGFIHGYTGLDVHAELPAPSPALTGQFAHQIVIDGTPVARTLTDVSLDALRRTTACARVERIQLGTGEVVTSAETCPTPEVAAKLGPVALDPQLRCTDGQTCAENQYTWTNHCTLHDPATATPPADWPPETEIHAVCPDAELPVDSGPPPDETTPTSSAEDGTTDETGPGEDPDAVESSCACTATGSPTALLPLPLLLALRRRRSPRVSDT